MAEIEQAGLALTALPAQAGGAQELGERVSDIAYADESLSEDARLLVAAALTDDVALDDLLGGQPGSGLRQPSAAPVPGPRLAEPVGAFLRRIAVRSFRGIGRESTLELSPAPGLTIVAGRNGSGKSSFAEALEFAVTGTTVRWRDKSSKQWAGPWRNVHGDLDPRIRVTLSEEAVGETTLEVSWPTVDGAAQQDVTAAARTVQRKGSPREEGVAGLGWGAPLERYRPLLSYDELGTLLTDGPSRLHDAMSKMLGLETLSTAIQRLETRRKSLSEADSRFKKTKTAVIATLSALTDDRAVEALKLVRATKNLDPVAVRSLAIGQACTDDGLTSALRQVLAVSLPDEATVSAAAEELREAARAVAAAADVSLDALEARHALLSAAIDLHQRDGDQNCPVCSVGHLDGDLVEALRLESAAIAETVGVLSAARTRQKAAITQARAVFADVPAALRTVLPDHLEQLRQQALSAWSGTHQALADDLVATTIADQLEIGHLAAAEALERLRTAAGETLRPLEEAWGAVAADLLRFADDAESMLADRPQLLRCTQARDWLKAHEGELKNDRLRPIADHAIRIWRGLRQESNVEISGLRLEGSATQRRVRITSSVDGADTDGIAVLSQGELHALALALFLPRAAAAQSPFRFIVLDDPVQAMDPSKVDGLLDVLSELAQTRQVVVFSHDDRLAEAARRGGAEATILEVTREQGSEVSVRHVLDPATRYLDEARAIGLDVGLPAETRSRLLPGMLRMAVESAARDRFFTVQLSAGRSPHDVAAAWQAVQKTGGKVSLALYGEAGRDLTGWLAKKPYRRPGLGVCTTGFHNGVTRDPRTVVEEVRALVADLRSAAL